MSAPMHADWIAVDWGTSNLRAYAMQGATVVERAVSESGMGRINPDAFEPTLDAVLDDWNAPQLPVVACGMLGARQGWIEVPYRFVPCPPLSQDLTRAPTRGGRPVFVVSGLAQRTPNDVMRGEETQIAGFLALNPGWDGVLCMPGTHTKWVHLSAGEAVSFQTFMTGELFALLSQASVLRHSLDGNDWVAEAFATALADAISKPEKLASRLFSLRATDLLDGFAPGVALASLSGYLIGAELAAARPYWLGQNLAVLGTGTQARAYRVALEQQGIDALMVDSERATIAGLTAAHRSLQELI